MKILSSFKDYYDFIAHRYGGGDPRIVYVRDRIAPREEWGESTLKVEIPKCPLYDPRSWTDSDADYSLAYLVVCGKAYLLSRQNTDVWPDNVNSWKLRDPETVKNPRRYFQRDFGVEFGKENPILIDLSQRINAPVFVITAITHKWRTELDVVHIAGQCPILKELGIPSKIPAAQMYQELASFMGNTIKPSPDTAPPVEVSNRDKILAAGFDLKQSFRHRV
jgi:hypothetical protein